MTVAQRSGRVELVPSYEESPNDPRADAYKLTQHRAFFELHCDATGEHIHFQAAEYTQRKREAGKAIVIEYSSPETAVTQLAQFSPITKKRLNLRREEPTVTLQSRHGTIPLKIFRGNYCGFTHPSKEIEFYWQLRTLDQRPSADRPQVKYRDAVLRRTAKGEKSTMTGMYLPHDKVVPCQPRASSDGSLNDQLDHANHEDDDEASPHYDVQLGRLLIRSDLNDFDKDLALVSFIAVFVRVIEAEKRTAFGNAFVRAMTIGEG